jgi:hypothetical protein
MEVFGRIKATVKNIGNNTVSISIKGSPAINIPIDYFKFSNIHVNQTVYYRIVSDKFGKLHQEVILK